MQRLNSMRGVDETALDDTTKQALKVIKGVIIFNFLLFAGLYLSFAISFGVLYLG